MKRFIKNIPFTYVLLAAFLVPWLFISYPYPIGIIARTAITMVIILCLISIVRYRKNK